MLKKNSYNGHVDDVWYVRYWGKSEEPSDGIVEGMCISKA